MAIPSELSASTSRPIATESDAMADRSASYGHTTARRFKSGFRAKLIAAMLAVSIFAVVGMGLATRIGFDRGFVDYLNARGVTQLEALQARITAEYENNGSWDFLLVSPTVWFRMVGIPGGVPEVPPLGSEKPEESFIDSTGTNLRIALYDNQRQFIIGSVESMSDAVERPIVVGGETVGWLYYRPIDQVITEEDERFRHEQNLMTFTIGFVGVLVCGLLALLLANRFLLPLRRIGSAIGGLARGRYDVELPTDADDEIAQLSMDVNHLALVLDRNESVRRNLMADVSHELRTPIAIISAELEAMSAGIRPLTEESVRALRSEVNTLKGLVNDVSELSSSDAGALSYRMHRIDLTDIVNCSVRAFEGRRNRHRIRLEFSGFGESVYVMGDEGRINQLFNNLLENSVRYTDPEGTMRIRCQADQAVANITVEDSEPGVPDELLDHLFDRFFRARPRRSQKGRGKGLGLAICRNIIEAHRGSVTAGPSELGGLRVIVTLPRIG